MSKTSKYMKISFSNSTIKNERNNRKISLISRLNSDKRYKIHIKNKILIREGKKIIKDKIENNSLFKSISYYKELYKKIKKENSTLQSSNNITNKIYKQNINKTFYDLIKIYRNKNYNTTDKYLNNVFKINPLIIKRNENMDTFLGFKTEKDNKYIRFFEKEKNIIKKIPNLLFKDKNKYNVFYSDGKIKRIKFPSKTLNIDKSENKMNPNELKFISLVNLNNMKKMVKKYKNEIKFSKNEKNIINSKSISGCFSFEKNSAPTKMINDNYEKEIEDLMKENDKNTFLEKLSNINILNFSSNELERTIRYYAKTFLKFNEHQIKKVLIPKNTSIDKELLIILNTFMKKNNKIRQKKKHHFLYNFELFNTIKEVDNLTFNLQKKLIENQTGD